MCKFESSQKDESRVSWADFLKACWKPRAGVTNLCKTES